MRGSKSEIFSSFNTWTLKKTRVFIFIVWTVELQAFKGGGEKKSNQCPRDLS